MRQLTSHIILYRTNHTNRQAADQSVFRRIILYEKKCVRQDKKQQNTLFSVDLERKGKAKRLQQLHKCKIDQNDTTERWKDVQDIQRRKRIPREQISTEIHREHTESIREDGMDITNDTWPFSLHQPPPHCTTRRIVVVSSSLFHSLFPVSNLTFFHHLLAHLSLQHLLFTQLLFPHLLFPHLPSSHLLFRLHFLALFSTKDQRRNSTQVMGELLSKEATSTLRSYPDSTT